MKGKKMSKNPIATITMENGKSIKIELYPEIAPNTVNNFISLIKKKFYDGLSFHRVIVDFMIQGGCPEGIGAGAPGYRIKGEFLSNGFKNDLKHKEGVISMARSSDPNSAGSQFFVMYKYALHLDGNYAAFGKVIEGMDEFDRIANVKKDRNDKPIIPETIKEITVKCFGEDYPEPEIEMS
jgi:peptidyl-prolyl cis-trans isomerase B (cyclophilin B)